jgi:UDP-N-acetylmuramoyl-tripeptide--D-alanyl-D-alanine ligase
MKDILKKIVARILALEAQAVLMRYKPHVIAVTGNMGKTSAKEAIYTVLSSARFVRKSEKSFNSEFGVPLTIIGRESGWNDPFKWLSNLLGGAALILSRAPYPEWLVLEVGADRPGDIKSIARWLAPEIAVITGVPDVPVHVEYFGSADAVAAEKKELAKGMKQGGSLILNGDDERVWAMRAEFRASAICYGFNSRNDVVASHSEIIYEDGVPAGMRFRVNHSGSSMPISIMGVVGDTHVYPILVACAAGLSIGMDLISIAHSFEGFQPIAGRMRLLEGASDTTIIDDTYNASPAATVAALETMSKIKASGRKICVLADMMELGKFSVEAHRNVGTKAARVADLLITVGIRSRGIAQAAIEAGLSEDRVRQYEQGESGKVGHELREALKEGDIILVKGSQSMRMEKAVKALLADESKATELLVRQDAAWQRR